MTDPVISMLERVIQPNGAFRQSPHLDAAWWTALTGETHPGFADDHTIPDRNVDLRRAKQKMFDVPFEVARTQLALLEVVRVDRLAGTVRILDLNPGSGSKLIATLDFLLLWWHVCHLYGRTFPVNQVVLEAATAESDLSEDRGRLLAAYADVLETRVASRAVPSQPEQLIAEWARQARWLQSESLVVISRHTRQFDLILSDSCDGSTDSDIPLGVLAPEGSAIICAPGTPEDSRKLSSWRRRTLQSDPNLFPISPCGQEFGNRLPECCDTCWTVRTEKVDHSATLQWLQSGLDEHGAGETNLVEIQEQASSWSYAIIGKVRDDGIPAANDQPRPTHEINDALRFMGTYRGRLPVSASDAGAGDFYAKVCPASNGGVPTVVKCSPEMISPDLKFGDRMHLAVLSRETKPNGVVLHTSTPQLRPLSDDPDESRVRAFIPEGSVEGNDDSVSAMDELGCRLFGFHELREFQHVILGRVLAGKSILGIAATGGGKSECFILPAMIMSGVSIVVSPLKSLMMDQYQERICRRYGLGDRVTWINGDLDVREQLRRLDRASRGHYKLIYLTPEQLEKQTTIEELRKVDQQVGLRYLAIDEAHCISQWGHDFRPSYLNTLRRMGDAGLNPVRIALTATASPAVRADICQELGLDNRPLGEGGDVYIHSSNRPELNLITRVVNRRSTKVVAIADELRPFSDGANGHQNQGSAIVFMPWTEHKGNPPSKADEVSPHVTSMASYLERQLETQVSIYHGAMDQEEQRRGYTQTRMHVQTEPGDVSNRQRGAEQQAFIRGDRRIMVATKGFGMGIDKPDIRTVVHATPPGNLEAYVQEAGRAGRDGEQANVVLYYSPEGVEQRDFLSDYQIQHNFLEQKRIRRVDVQAIARFLFARLRDGERSFQVTVEELRDAILDYCAKRNYDAPEFRPRRENNTESPEHADLLDRGHEYNQWAEYLDRLIGELHAFASLIAGSGYGSFFASVSKSRRHRDPSIKGMTLNEQRARFGARYRAWPWKANARAQDAGRERPDLDDWFSREEIARPVGWDVALGSAFKTQESLVAFVDAFCTSHEQRYHNAHDSYTRLLTDYLGVKPDGTLDPHAKSECLRAVMLGYLKTNEIVQDGNCLSCSNCVPDERFDRYTLEERRHAVVRIDDEIQHVLKVLEAMVDALPDAAVLETLLAVLRRNTESAHALRRYIAGWTGRVLDEEPEHIAVRWLRLSMAIDDEVVELRVDEFAGHLRSLSQHLDDADASQLWQIIERIHERPELQGNRDFLEIQAHLARRLGRHHDEAEALSTLSELVGDAIYGAVDETKWVFERLRDLHGPRSSLPDADQYSHAQTQLARLSVSEGEAQSHYQQLRQRWDWDDVIEELRILELPRHPRTEAMFGLLRVWIEQHQDDPVQIAEALATYFSRASAAVIENADGDTVSWIVDIVGPDNLARSLSLLDILLGRLLVESSGQGELDDHVVELLGVAFSAGSELSPRLASSLTRMITAGESSHALLYRLSAFRPEQREAREQIALSLASELGDLNESGLARWLLVFPIELHEQSPQLSRRVLSAISRPVMDEELRDEFATLAESALWREQPTNSIHEHWISLNRSNPGVLGEYIQDCVEADPPEVERAERAFTRLLDSSGLRDLGGFLKWVYRSEAAGASVRLSDAAELFRLLVQWASDRKASAEGQANGDLGSLQREFEAWCEGDQINRIQQMNPEDAQRILDLCLRRMNR